LQQPQRLDDPWLVPRCGHRQEWWTGHLNWSVRPELGHS